MGAASDGAGVTAGGENAELDEAAVAEWFEAVVVAGGAGWPVNAVCRLGGGATVGAAEGDGAGTVCVAVVEGEEAVGVLLLLLTTIQTMNAWMARKTRPPCDFLRAPAEDPV